MEEPRMRLGSDDVWLEPARNDGESWQATADWCSWLTADFAADLGVAEVVDSAARVLRHSARCTPRW